jgi:hypothetical protein
MQFGLESPAARCAGGLDSVSWRAEGVSVEAIGQQIDDGEDCGGV